MTKKASLLLAILILLLQFGFPRVSSAANELCETCTGKPCECCEEREFNISNDPQNPNIVTQNCVSKCSEFEQIQIKIRILNGADCGDDLTPSKFDDNGNGVVDYDDLVRELKLLFNTTQSSAISIGDVLQRGMRLFVRGDFDGDGAVTPADATKMTAWSNNKSNPGPKCMKAVDTDDNGQVDNPTTFSTYIANKTIKPPYPTAGKDPTPDDLSCGLSIATMLGTTTTTTTSTIPPPTTTQPPQ